MATSDKTEHTQYAILQNSYDVNLENSNENQEFVRSLKVLDPDDTLMKRFQNALKAHLTKVDERLNREFDELTIHSKQREKERLQKGNEMYEAQIEITKQINMMEKWKMSLESIRCEREKKENELKVMKKTRNNVQQQFNNKRTGAETMSHDIENISSLCRRLTEYEEELNNHLAVAKRMSQKDASVQRELIRQKQEMDYIMLNASNTIWKLEKEIEELKRHIDLKNDEKLIINQTIADADADLEELEREQKHLVKSWNKVIFSVEQRDKVYDELSTQCTNMRESVRNMHARFEKVKKDTKKEMEDNERLTGIQWKVDEDINCNEMAIKIFNDKSHVFQYKTDTTVKLVEYSETQFQRTTIEHQQLINEENVLDRELEKLSMHKNTLENEIITKLEDKMTQNSTLKRLNKCLHDTRDAMKQFEMSMLLIENQYGKCLLKMKKLNNDVSIEKAELMEFNQINNQKNMELNKLHNEIEKCDILIERKQKKIGLFNEKMNEISANRCDNGIDMVAPHVIKIAALEKNIEEIEIKNKENQHHWLRREAVIVNLTDERNNKLQGINRLSKQIIIMQQKNLKLENALNKEHIKEQNINRRINEFHQRLLKINTILANHKEMRDQLQDKNFIAKDEYTRILQRTERDLINHQNNIKELKIEKCALEDKLRNENHNNLSWNKKLKLAIETTQSIKQEQNPGGDVAVMRSEIRKMEMRLSYLKKVQEKMIKDMEYCVTRREMIVDAALTKQMKNPKVMHNKQVMFDKRMNGRRLEIKQIKKMIKSVESEVSKLAEEKEKLLLKEKENENLFKTYQDEIIKIDKEIAEGDIMKHHKLECLVRKQRKIRMLQAVRDGKYKISCKSMMTLNDDLDNQKTLNNDLIEIMEQTNQDFPHLKDDVTKILLTLQSN